MRKALTVTWLWGTVAGLLLPLGCGSSGGAGTDEDVPFITHHDALPEADAGGDAAPPDVPITPDSLPAGLAELKTQVNPETVEAGMEAAVYCLGFDQAGNALTVSNAAVEVEPKATVYNFHVKATKAGAYTVTCVPGLDLPDVKLVPAALTVLPADPETLAIALSPKQQTYAPGDTAKLAGSGADGYGNQIKEIPLAGIASDPPGLVIVGDDQNLTFSAEGKGKLHAVALENPALSAQIDLTVDAGPPLVVVTFPPRASEQAGTGSLTVTGKVTDPSGIAAATLNGKPLSPAADGTFSHKLDPQLGLNLIIIEAKDALGSESRHVQSFIYSGSYYPVPDGPLDDMLVPNGVFVYLDNASFYKPNDAYGPSLSYIVQEFLLNLDLSTLIPSPVAQQQVAWCTYDITLSNIQYGKPTVMLAPADGGVSVYVEIPNLSADLSAPAAWCPDLNGKVTASFVTIDVFAAMWIDGQSQLQVALTEVDVQFVGLVIDLTGIAGEIIQALMGFFQDSLTTMIEEQFEQQIQAEFEQQLGKLLGSVNLDNPLAIPPFMPGAYPSNVTVHLRPSQLQSGDWGLSYAMLGGFDAFDSKGFPLLGSPARSGCLQGKEDFVSVDGEHYFEAAIHDDVLNQVMMAVFLDGGVDAFYDANTLAELGTDTSSLGVENLAVTATALLPPVVSDCAPDGKLRVAIGDLRLETSFGFMGKPLEMTLYFFFSAVLELELTGEPGNQTIVFGYGDLDYMDMHFESLNDEWKGNEELLSQLIKDTFLPQFFDTIKNYPYSFSIAELPLDQLVPQFSGWTMAPVIDSLERREGHMLVKAHMVVEQ